MPKAKGEEKMRYFLSVMGILSLLMVTGAAQATLTPGEIAAAQKGVNVAVVVFVTKKANKVSHSLAVNEPALAAGISDDDMNSCVDGIEVNCQRVMERFKLNLTKMLTPQYRLNSGMFLLSSNMLKYSKPVAQQLISAIRTHR